MTNSRRDPLLLAGKLVCLFMQGVMVFGGIVLIVAIGATVMCTPELAAQAGLEPFPADFPKATLAAIMVIGLAMLAALFLFFGRLRRVIATVGEGDPFQPANAQRLGQMAWLMLGAQLLVLPAIPLAMQLAQFADEVEDVSVNLESGLDLSGVLLVLVLFILARVFRHGAAMREDLEGTV